jgi:hypothetical protein
MPNPTENESKLHEDKDEPKKDNSQFGKEGIETTPWNLLSVKETEGKKTYTFYAATTVPDRCGDNKVAGEILTKRALEKMMNLTNDTSRLGGQFGAYRTVSMFHDRVYLKDQKLEEAGYVLPTARVVPHKEYAGHYALEVDVEVNDMYNPLSHPDYTPDKIKYKIEKGAIGLSIEYFPLDKEYPTALIEGKPYRVVDDFLDYAGVGFARANVIGNPTAVAIKESMSLVEEKTMAENNEAIQLKEQVAALEAQVKEIADLKVQLKEATEKGTGNETQVKQLQEKLKEFESKSMPEEKIKELLAKTFESVSLKNKPAIVEVKEMNAYLKEIQSAVDKNDWATHTIATDAFLKENSDALYKSLQKGIEVENAQTLQVKCVGRGFRVVSTPQTKDVVSSATMDEATYYQTNAMFADRYVQGITETFLFDDNLMKVLPKEQHVGGNDYYQWKIWVDGPTLGESSTSLAVDPSITSLARSVRKFEKMQTPIKEYRDAVEVTDFVQYHSRQAVGDLLAIEVERAAKFVAQSMASDIFKENADGASVQLLGLEAVADSTGNTTLYGKTRSTANRLKAATLTDTYVSTSEAITSSVLRTGYEKVLAAGSNVSDIVITMNPAQCTKLFNTFDNTAATYNSIINSPVLTMQGAPASFGFQRNVIPHFDGIPIIRDYNCQTDAFYVVDVSAEKGFVLVTSKPLGLRGLAKIGASEAAFVNFYGCTVYKNPRNVFLHDGLT